MQQSQPTRAERGAVRAIRRRIGSVFQQFNLWPHLTALGNVMEVSVHVEGRARSEVLEEAEALLDKVACRTAAMPGPRSSPAVGISAWPSPGRWQSSRRRCC